MPRPPHTCRCDSARICNRVINADQPRLVCGNIGLRCHLFGLVCLYLVYRDPYSASLCGPMDPLPPPFSLFQDIKQVPCYSASDSPRPLMNVRIPVIVARSSIQGNCIIRLSLAPDSSLICILPLFPRHDHSPSTLLVSDRQLLPSQD